MIDVLKLENTVSKARETGERDKVQDKIEHERGKMQTLEIDLNDLTMQFKDTVARRKSIKLVSITLHIQMITKLDLGATNGLIL
jgi:hypothetical protein